jgi:hypothetical protein
MVKAHYPALNTLLTPGIQGTAGLLPMKTTAFHHSKNLSSSVIFKPQEDGRRAKKTYIELASWLVLPARNVVFQTPESGWPTRQLYSRKICCKTWGGQYTPALPRLRRFL